MAAKKNLTVRLEDDTREILELIANREMRPLANQINFFLKQAMEAYLRQRQLQAVRNPEDNSISLEPTTKAALEKMFDVNLGDTLK